VEKSRYAYVVSLLITLKTLLNNNEIRSKVDKSKKNIENQLLTITDGLYYKTNEFFSHINSLGIIFYGDDLCITNPLGANTARQKVIMFYWTLANIPPELRSSLKAINLYAIVKTVYLKKFGLHKILEPFIENIKIL